MSYCKVILIQRANRIRVLALWPLDLKVQDMNQHHKVTLKSNFDSKSEQDLCVGIVTRGSIWHLDLKLQDLKYHHNVILQSNFESKSKQDSCVGIVTRGLIWHLDLKVQDMNQHHKVLHFQVQMSNWTSCYNPNTQIPFALWFKITFQYDFVVLMTCNKRFIWHLDLKWQDMKYHNKVILQSSFKSKS